MSKKALHSKSCLICDRINKINGKKNPYFVRELSTGYIVLGDHQYWPGYTLFLAKKHVSELHELTKPERNIFLQEMAQVAEAVWHAFSPKKLNYELLGNSDNHLHWHIFPRYIDELYPKQPTWIVDPTIRKSEKYIPNTDTLKQLKEKMLSALSFLDERS